MAWNLYAIDAKFAVVEPVNTCVNYLNKVEGKEGQLTRIGGTFMREAGDGGWSP